jgi:hypothetical protein
VIQCWVFLNRPDPMSRKPESDDLRDRGLEIVVPFLAASIREDFLRTREGFCVEVKGANGSRA